MDLDEYGGRASQTERKIRNIVALAFVALALVGLLSYALSTPVVS